MTCKFGEKKLKFAVFGTGWWSNFQIPAWLEIGNLELVALYNRTASKAHKVAEKYGISRVFDDPEELLKNVELDFVDIITEAPAHADLVKLAAKYKKPVVCQKPMAPEYHICLEMLDVCKKNGVPLYINENYRWQPHFRILKRLIEEGHIGRPYRADIQLSTGGPEQLENQPFLKTLRHFALFDMGSHVFDVARFLFGEPDQLYCQAVRTVDWIAGDDVFAAVLTYKDMLCTCEIVDYSATKIYVEGTKGAIELRPDNSMNIITKQGTHPVDCIKWENLDWISKEDLKILGPECAQSIIDCQKNIL
ncbi:MAG: Gfo/Idh/MocA family oxidoreductase, partial [Clostridiales bacterium]|nr:Gfo/Idh/MocA family oxidoreductase [Clostridiales bacterium]